MVYGKIALFAGKGAVLASDVQYALEKMRIKYEKVNETQVKEGKLKYFECLIIPGGYTETILDSLTSDGLNEICNFVKSGGGYIGICAGAYIATDKVEIHPAYKRGKLKGLGIISIQNIRKEGIGVRRIKIVAPDHPITKNCPKELKIWYQNGPFIVPGKGIEVIANFDESSDSLPSQGTEYAAIVCSYYGEGRVVIFSPHPEGSKMWRIKPAFGTLQLLRNAYEWVTCKEKI